MKAKRLAELLMENPDFEVDVPFSDPVKKGEWPNSRSLKVTGICDIGYSSKLIRLDAVEED
jgi:hypothetical protein